MPVEGGSGAQFIGFTLGGACFNGFRRDTATLMLASPKADMLACVAAAQRHFSVQPTSCERLCSHGRCCACVPHTYVRECVRAREREREREQIGR